MRSTATVSIVSVALAFLSMCVPTRPMASSPLAPAAAAKDALAGEARAAWVWGSTIRAQGAEVVAGRLHERGMTDAIVLVKGTAGTVAYTSAIAPPAAAGIDTLGEFVAACHARGIRVHAWLNYHQDDAYGITRTGKQYSIWHVRTMPAPPSTVGDGRICPLRAQEGYNAYFLSIVQEILDRYDVDGIHLDYIRYPHTVYCFCPAHQARAAALGIDFTHVRTLINQTYYPAPGDGKTFFNAFAAGDPDAVQWVAMREAEINDVVHMVKDVVDAHNASRTAGAAEVRLSAALMPEGGLSDMVTDGARSDQFALCHYAQGYEAISALTSFIAPMSYHKDFGKPPAWVGQVTAGAVAKAAPCPVWAGIQVYDVTSQAVADALEAARSNGAAGFALFRYGVSTTGEQASQAIVPRIESLIQATAAAGDEDAIDHGLLNSLAQKLRSVQASLDAGATEDAIDQLGAYINELEAQAGKHVDHPAARALAADAAWLRDMLRS